MKKGGVFRKKGDLNQKVAGNHKSKQLHITKKNIVRHGIGQAGVAKVRFGHAFLFLNKESLCIFRSLFS
jgi:hypothetical protein